MTQSGFPSPSGSNPFDLRHLTWWYEPDPDSWELSPWLQCSSQARVLLQGKFGTGVSEAPKWVTWMSWYSSLPSSWWSGSIISARIVVPFLAIKYLGRKSIKCPGSRDISVVLLLCPLVEGFPLWEPEPLNPQNPDFRDGMHKISVIGSHIIVKPFLLLSLGFWTKVFNLLGTQHHIKVTDLECTLCPGWWHPILQGTTSKLAH